MELSRLKVGDEDFLVTSMIERCPKVMMLRELLKNAFEAVECSVSADRRVEVAPLVVDGVRKLTIWNTGNGMNREELFRMCDIASSIGKENSLEHNFGMGAKVASLPSNQHGIRYRSCHKGQVYQVIMGKRGGFYGRVRQTLPDGSLTDVMEVTELAAQSGRPLNCDWTEVVLLGDRPEQDTVTDPYGGAPKVSSTWVAEELYARFYNVPDNVNLVLRPGVHLLEGDQLFVPLQRRAQTSYERYEAVHIDRGITVHFIFDATDPSCKEQTVSARNALQPSRSGAAVIFKGEMYDLRRDRSWTNEAPVYGFPFGARNFSFLIELPDDFPVRPDAYRQFLRYRENMQQQVEVKHFASEVIRSRPEWVIELLRQFAPDAQHAESVREEMSTLFAYLGIRRRWWPAGSGKPRLSGSEGLEYEVAPQIVALRDPADIHERGLENKAARFYRETHQIFFNYAYSAVENLRIQLEIEFATVEDSEKLHETALVISEQAITSVVCRKLVYALCKRGVWADWEIDQATSPASLTLAADDYGRVLLEVRQEMARRLEIDFKPSALVPAGQATEAARQRFAEAMEILLAAGRGDAGNKIFEVLLRFGDQDQ